MDQFGKRLQAFRLAAGLSQIQVHQATGIGQSHVARTELGQVNISISHVSLYAELFGVKGGELLNFGDAVPSEAILKKNVVKFLKSRGFDPSLFLKENQGLTHILEKKILGTKFLAVPRSARDIADYCMEKYGAEFTTSHISLVLDRLLEKGLLEKLKTDRKRRFEYRKR